MQLAFSLSDANIETYTTFEGGKVNEVVSATPGASQCSHDKYSLSIADGYLVLFDLPFPLLFVYDFISPYGCRHISEA